MIIGMPNRRLLVNLAAVTVAGLLIFSIALSSSHATLRDLPRKNLHKDYDLPTAPPLLIGFTRTYPVLLQAVVSYITAGWPPSQIYLQNFFLSLTYAHDWPYYFWSHMDVLALSYEDGRDGLTPPYTDPAYKSLYALCLTALRDARASGKKWATRFFAYDHLALVNPAAFEDVGGWDTLIPYYLTDCDMHSRLTMKGWTMEDAKAGIITDVASALGDLRALYRVEGVEVEWVDPNPPPKKTEEELREEERKKEEAERKKKEEEERKRKWWSWGKKRALGGAEGVVQGAEEVEKRDVPPVKEARDDDVNLARWNALREASDQMFRHKHGDRERNTWQLGQHGGEGEPFYYKPAGLAEALDLITETGREVYRRKWGHRDCALISGAGLKFDDAWRVEKDW
ncbi:hypothetical protein NEMBOFW57_009320 [Staphylotrichum longicolle]|uniref:Uncharacterized protein n=1 Tax=Staphylotrichum longicolle TaxID=669026 RepID=A0AAD4ENV6_9PEZI|nr:hypothetical protein NEMBOFW57_009320 [Staphylotrichum longicolle]